MWKRRLFRYVVRLYSGIGTVVAASAVMLAQDSFLTLPWLCCFRTLVHHCAGFRIYAVCILFVGRNCAVPATNSPTDIARDWNRCDHRHPVPALRNDDGIPWRSSNTRFPYNIQHRWEIELFVRRGKTRTERRENPAPGHYKGKSTTNQWINGQILSSDKSIE